MRNPLLWFVAGVFLREAFHAALTIWSSHRATKEQSVSESWRNEHIEESGKSGR